MANHSNQERGSSYSSQQNRLGQNVDVSPGGLGESSSGREDPTVPPTADESEAQTILEVLSEHDGHTEENQLGNVGVEEHHSGT